MDPSAIITGGQFFECSSERGEVETFTIPESLADLPLLDAFGGTVCYGLWKQLIVALVASDGASTTSASTRLEPVPVSNRLEGNVLGALDAFLLVVYSVELVGGVGVGANHVKNKLLEVTAFIVFFIEYTNERLENSQRIVTSLGNVESNDETVALFYTENKAILTYTTRVLANVGGIDLISEDTALFESLLFEDPISVNFRNTVFTHFFTYINKKNSHKKTFAKKH
jgi:hypothetical protein